MLSFYKFYQTFLILGLIIFSESILKAQCPTIIVSPLNGSVCRGTPIGLIATCLSNCTNITYTWAPDSSLNTNTGSLVVATPSVNTIYTVTASIPSCSVTATIPITVSNVTATFPSASVRCFGDSTGTITVNASGGINAYNVIWSGPVSGDPAGFEINSPTGSYTINNLPVGTYNVTVRDANNCTFNSSPITITQPSAPLTTTQTPTNALCNGAATGTINVNASGGTAGYNVSWSGQSAGNPAGTEIAASGGNYTVTALASGNYNVTVTDANGCSTTFPSVIGQPTPLAATFTPSPASCFGVTNATISVSASNATPGYNVSWSGTSSGNPAGTEIGASGGNYNITGLGAGNYVITVTDANGCTFTSAQTVTQPSQVTGTAVQTSALCNGGASGSINLTVNSGIPNYTFSWSNGRTTEDISNLATGTYTVTITDATSCTGTASVSVTQPTAVTPTATFTQPTCFNGANGSINMTPGGGTPGYTFSWSNGRTTEDISSLTASTYRVTVTDANGCTGTVAVTVTQPTAVSSSSTVTNVLCNGGSTGAINLTPSGGTPTYRFSWSNGRTTEDITALAIGTYLVTITDNNNCTGTASITVSQPSAITTSAVSSAVSCTGGTNGSINLTVSGGTTPYTFLWTGGRTTEDITGLAAGSYTVTVTDANGCTSTRPVNVTQPTAVAGTVAFTAVSCNGGSNGTINLSPSGGTPNYTFLWSNGRTTVDISALTAGSYTVTITDQNGCTTTRTAAVTQPNALTATYSNTNVSCNGGTNGIVNLTPNGGVPAYTYAWNNGRTTQDISNLTAGVYVVTITDANGCTLNSSTTITQNTVISNTTTITNVLCNGRNTGVIDITPLGGTPAYTYRWSTTALTQDISSLAAGVYFVTITDANGCSITSSATITQPSAVTPTATNVPTRCFGASNGSIDLTVSGGTPNYQYNWGAGRTTQDLTNLAAGTYTVTITDNNGCTSSFTTTVSQPTSIAANLAPSTVLCFGGSTGSVNLTPSGGTPTYTFNWSNGRTTEDISGLSTGTYVVTVTDANNCTFSTSVAVTQPLAVTATFANTNVNCSGGNNGSINMTTSGGVPTYTYSWSNGRTTEDISALTANSYSVTITDANSCTFSASTTITQAITINNTVTVTNVLCNGRNTGVIDITPSGGTPAYTYRWSTSALTQDVSSLAAGVYFVTITDANGCSITSSATVTQPSAVTPTATNVPTSCFGATNGSIDLTVSGGTPNYQYNWGAGRTTQDLTNLAAGTYTVTITDNNGCTSSFTTTVSQPTSIAANLAPSTVLCFGGSTGSVNLTPSGGTPTYTFNWSNGRTTEDISGLSTGSYVVTVTDANSCTFSNSVSVTQPSAVTATFANTNVNCNGFPTGAINMTPTGGTGAYTYIWNNGSTTQDLTGITAANYFVTVTDVNSCTFSASTTITQPTAITATNAVTNNICNGGNTGSVNLSVGNGVAPFRFSWSNGRTTEDISSLAAGSYIVTITDFNNCSVTSSVTISQPSAVTPNATVTNPGCFSGTNGSINNTTSGGTGPYQFNWSNGRTTEDVTGISSGSYTVTITDAIGCTSTSVITLSQPSTIAATITPTSVLCNGTNSGSINLTPSGGTAGYNFNWSNGNTTEDISGILAGAYTVTVTDNNNCTASFTSTVTEPTVLNPTITNTNVNCNGGNNASINLSSAGGTPNYTFLWSNGRSTEDISNLTAATYTVTVTDNNGCTVIRSATVTQPSAIITNITATDANCNGVSNGSASILVSNGTPAYTYLWSNNSTTSSISGIGSGAYAVTVTDFNGCTISSTVTVSQPSVISTTFANTGALCNGSSGGSVNISTTGGFPTYNYLWSNGSTTEDISGLTAGVYSVTITDNVFCSVVFNTNITQPTVVNGNAVPNPVICNGGSSGSVNLSASGGNGTFSFIWNNGQTSEDISGLSVGTYNVTITDLNSCTGTVSATVSEPSLLNPSISNTNVSCNAGSNAVVNVTPFGGTAGYNYNWSNGSSTEDISNITAGAYFVSVTDNNGCSVVLSATVTEPSAITVSTSIIDNICNNGTLGSINLSVSNGTPNYSFQWSNGATTEDISGLVSGSYTFTLTDANNCTQVNSLSVSQPSLINNVFTNNAVLCNGQANGSLSVSSTGGTGSYTYLWSNGSTGTNISNLPSANYSVTVTDANGCTLSSGVSVNQPSVLTIVTANVTDATCSNPGSVDISVSGGTSGYTYLWSNGRTTEDLTGLSSGTFTVTTTDANGCTSTLIAGTVNSIGTPAAVLDSTNDLQCNGANNGTISVTVSGGNPGYIFLWSNGNSTEDLTGLSGGTYNLTVVDANSCFALLGNIFVNEPTAIIYQTNIVNTSCAAGNIGEVNVTVNGGTGALNFNWNNGATTQNLSGLSAGFYDLTITDANGCSVSNATDTVTSAGSPVVSVNNTANALCNASANGSIDILVQNGTAPFNYQWSNNATTEDISALSAGVYAVQVTDVNGCTATFNQISITEPSSISATSANIFATCNQANGSINLQPSGGTGPYSYLWSNGPASEDISALSSGNYSVTISDANGCSLNYNTNIIQSGGVNFGANLISNISCNNLGSINISIANGTSPFTYNWSNGATTEDVSGLNAGPYTVTVIDANSCSTTFGPITITTAGIPTASIISTVNATCNGNSDADIDISVIGGTGVYTYNWDNGANTQDIFNLSAGTYNVTVTDNAGCTASLSNIVISEPSSVSATSTANALNCFGDGSGEISVLASGGTPVYGYTWSNGSTNSVISGLNSGTYTVTVNDASGCTFVLSSISVSEPSAVSISSVQVNNASCGASNGSVDINISGGTANYSFSWSDGQIIEDASGLSGGVYNVTISDANSCTIETSVTIGGLNNLTASVNATGELCYQPGTGLASTSVNGGTVPYNYIWSNGETSSDVSSLSSGNYTVTVTDATGCSFVLNTSVSSPLIPTLNAVLLPGNARDTIISKGDSVFVSNFDNQSSLGVTYEWSYIGNGNGNISNPFNIQTAVLPEFEGDYLYILTATSPDGCIATDTVQITVGELEPEIPTAFSPNGDGSNEKFEVVFLDKTRILEFVVFNRWGTEVYSNIIDASWDGTYKGEPQPRDVYLYLIIWRSASGNFDKVVKRGHVTLLR